MELTDIELMEVNGCGFNTTWGFILTISITFLIGVVDGILRPLECR